MSLDKIIEDLEVDWEEIIPGWAVGHTASHYQEGSESQVCKAASFSTCLKSNQSKKDDYFR